MENLPVKKKEYKGVNLKANLHAQALTNTLQEPLLVLDQDFRVLSATNSFYLSYGVTAKDTEGREVFNLQNGLWEIPELRSFLNEVNFGEHTISKKSTFNLPDVEGQQPVIHASYLQLDGGEKIILLSFKFQAAVIPSRREDHLKNFQNILAHAPAMICILRGPEHIFEVANENYLQLVGYRDVIGKTARQALPEIENQGFFELLDNVYTSGKPFVGKELPIKFKDDPNHSYLNFVYQPTRDNVGNVDGIFVHAIDVTAHVQARKKIEESEQELRKLIDTVPAIIWITSSDGYANYLNKNWFRYTGQTRKEAVRYGWLNAIHEEDLELAAKSFLEATSNRSSYHVSYRLKTKKGDYRWVIASGSPKYDAVGEYEGMIGTVVDVHEEKMKEELVKEKEHRIRSIVEEATVATALYTGEEMRIDIANDAMLQVWGKGKDVVGKTLQAALPELDGQPFHQLLDKVYKTGNTYWGKEDKVELMINGELKTGYFNFTYKPLRDEKGVVYGILNMGIDVTEIINSRNILKESESHFRQMADLMPEKVTNTNAKGEYKYFNQIWLDYTGLDSQVLKSKGVEGVIHPDDKKPFSQKWQRSLESGEDFEMEIRILSKNGNYKWHLSRAEAVRDENGKIKMWISTNTEIHKIKEEEKKKEDFLKMVSHELKTPVTSIKGYVQLLLSQINKEGENLPSSLPLKPSLERIDQQIVRLTRLISEILDLSRLEENKLILKKENFKINDLVKETVQDIIYTNTQHKIIIENNFECEVFADKHRIGQVLINFITNAIKYSSVNQDVVVKIEEAPNNKVSVCVKDKGIGIDKINHRKIFKRFYRVGVESEETYSGFGIGLYLAQEIINRHNGKIKVKSEIGEGSEFSFLLSVAS